MRRYISIMRMMKASEVQASCRRYLEWEKAKEKADRSGKRTA